MPTPKSKAEDDDWETDPDFVNSQTEEEQRRGGAVKGDVGVIDMNEIKASVLQQEAEKSKSKSGFERGYGGSHGHEKSGDQTTDPKPGKKAWVPKGNFDDKMSERREITQQAASSQPKAPTEISAEASLTPAAQSDPADKGPQMPQPPQTPPTASSPASHSSPTTPEPPATPPPPKPAGPPPAANPAPPPKPAGPPPKPAGPPPPKPPAPPSNPPASPPKPPISAPSSGETAPAAAGAGEESAEARRRALEAIGQEDQEIRRRDGEQANAYHSYGEEKVRAFSDYINLLLPTGSGGAGEGIAGLPLNPDSDDLFKAVTDGVLLCRLVNAVVPGTVFDKAINLRPKSVHHKVENLNLAINSARAMGCSVVNIGAADLLEGRPHLVLGLVWQMIKMSLLSKVSLRECPELVALLLPGEDLVALRRLTPEQILMRWVNYHLAQAGCSRTVSNFSGDLKDSEVLTRLLARLVPAHADLSPLAETDLRRRAVKMLGGAERAGCGRFLTADSVVAGNPQLNLAFLALLFNRHPGLTLPVAGDAADRRAELLAMLAQDDGEDSREERVFRNWINSHGPSQDLHSLLEDCKAGEPILEVMEKLEPGRVDWKKVKRGTKVQIKTIENCNYVVECAREAGLNIVNLGGKDIADGNKKLVLGLLWQLMRRDTLSLLDTLGEASGRVTDADLVRWANDRATGDGPISGLSDPELRRGRFLLRLVDAVVAGSVDWSLVEAGTDDGQCEHNAKYLLSVARKVGCPIFLLWEDVVEVKPKMLMTLFGSLMALDKARLAAAKSS